MKTIAKTAALLACSAVFAAPRAARADEGISEWSYGWHESRLQTGYGVSTILGGGVTGFTDKAMRDTITNNVGGLWDFRVTLGSHTPLALDISYIGTAAKINALTGTKWGTLVGTSAEAALRYNVLPHYAWNPYVFAGVGWQHYDINGISFTMADTGMNPSDNSVVFPMGTGISYRDASGLVVDLRGTFRANADYGLVLNPTSPDHTYAPMHAWEASGAVGYEF